MSEDNKGKTIKNKIYLGITICSALYLISKATRLFDVCIQYIKKKILQI